MASGAGVRLSSAASVALAEGIREKGRRTLSESVLGNNGLAAWHVAVVSFDLWMAAAASQRENGRMPSPTGSFSGETRILHDHRTTAAR
jgi:hypothetical protein